MPSPRGEVAQGEGRERHLLQRRRKSVEGEMGQHQEGEAPTEQHGKGCAGWDPLLGSALRSWAGRTRLGERVRNVGGF